jgi:hypothetical protein
MSAQVLRGSKQEIAEKIMQIPGEVQEVIVYVEEPIEPTAGPGEGTPIVAIEDIFAEMEPYMSNAADVDCSREAIYTRMEGE